MGSRLGLAGARGQRLAVMFASSTTLYEATSKASQGGDAVRPKPNNYVLWKFLDGLCRIMERKRKNNRRMADQSKHPVRKHNLVFAGNKQYLSFSCSLGCEQICNS
ncbi:hypothetical protein BDA96_05G237300 [Sorghum bicolor]|uniref:Uncharacterized protein n=2 Tax=Sorghum bicolor TaxID=4558 RepID=A0A1Z5RJZ1_SORBI|nr:hypothetical protein BDA96_05G237300 [Sorghum bicolor]OQU84053.1 hypothetical protein SORBI_3005G221425 [Sorghum bicolor]OQU84054.1 hypothetical protein SORBI_3005G221425 [Sorghum bicolor]